MYCLENGMENMNLLKSYRPSGSFCTFIYESAPALKFQVYLVRPWLAASGVFDLGLEPNTVGHRHSRTEFGNPCSVY